MTAAPGLGTVRSSFRFLEGEYVGRASVGQEGQAVASVTIDFFDPSVTALWPLEILPNASIPLRIWGSCEGTVAVAVNFRRFPGAMSERARVIRLVV